jgi:hypothetical protein
MQRVDDLFWIINIQKIYQLCFFLSILAVIIVAVFSAVDHQPIYHLMDLERKF